MNDIVSTTMFIFFIGQVAGHILFYFRKKNRVWKIKDGRWQFVKKDSV